MTVAELIERLREMPQEMEVLIDDSEWGPSVLTFAGVEELKDRYGTMYRPSYYKLMDDLRNLPTETKVVLSWGEQ